MTALPWEGARRLPYFYSTGPNNLERRPIVCPQCILYVVLEDPEDLRGHYHVSRSVMCGRCGILIGPINEEEIVDL